MTRVGEAVRELRAAVDDGRLRAVCLRHGIDLLVWHGSSRKDPDRAGDVDLAYLPVYGQDPDHLAVVNDLLDLLGDTIDVLPIHRADPVAAWAALGRGERLVELTEHRFAEAQMRAFGEYRDTQRYRDLALSLVGRR